MPYTRRVPLILLFVTLSAIAATESPPFSHPFFHLDASAKRALVEKALTLRPGDSYETVVGRLGKPKIDKVLMRKESTRVVGRTLKYYAVIWDSGLVNELHDELVDVFLDPTDHVVSVGIRVTLDK
jgi:hypothetical protein